MDDFLGTSIQFSEQQILRLEREHAAEKERIVNELIENGFLDSDYESSTDYSEDSSDTESNEENECDISAVDNDIDIDNEHNDLQIVENEEKIESEMEMMDVADFEDFNIGLMHLLEMVLSASMDFKSFLVFCIMAIALPHYMQQRGSDIYGGIEYENDAQSTEHSAHEHFVRKTVWIYSSASAHIKSSNDDGSDNDDDDDSEENAIERTLNLDIMSMTLNTATNKMFAEFERRQFKISPNDLYQCSLSDLTDYIPQRRGNAQLPPLLLSFGAGAGFEFKANNGMMRVFKETLSDPISRQFLQSRGIFTLILSFAGIAAFAASNSMVVE